jgi:hypothetical protein
MSGMGGYWDIGYWDIWICGFPLNIAQKNKEQEILAWCRLFRALLICLRGCFAFPFEFDIIYSYGL